MKVVLSKPLLRKIREAQPDWFSRGNKRFFNDVEYKGYYGKATGKAYLVRSTYAWTDMLGGTKRLHYRINELDQDTLKIKRLIDDEFSNIYDVKDWLKVN